MRILLIEDDCDFCELVTFALQKEGYVVDACHEGDDGLRWMKERAHDIVLLDRMLPRLNGATLLTIARADGIKTPVMMMTAMGTTDQKIEGLDLGADDYIVKPFAVGELLARIRALCRRPIHLELSSDVQYMGLLLHPLKMELQYRDKHVSLTKTETTLLKFLMKNPEETIPRHILFSHVWGPDAGVEDGNLDNYVHFVRKRLKSVQSPIDIITVRQTGYCLGKVKTDEIV